MVTGLDTSLYSLVAEHPLTCNEKVRGSTPRGGFYSVCSQRTTVDATRTGIAQSVERGPFKPVVVGSSPTFGVDGSPFRFMTNMVVAMIRSVVQARE